MTGSFKARLHAQGAPWLAARNGFSAHQMLHIATSCTPIICTAYAYKLVPKLGRAMPYMAYSLLLPFNGCVRRLQAAHSGPPHCCVLQAHSSYAHCYAFTMAGSCLTKLRHRMVDMDCSPRNSSFYAQGALCSPLRFRKPQARDDVHGLQLLEEQLAGIGQLQGGHLLRGLRAGAHCIAYVGVKIAQQTTVLAHVHLHSRTPTCTVAPSSDAKFASSAAPKIRTRCHFIIAPKHMKP